MDRTWLVRIFEEAGVPAEDAVKAADASWRRLLRRERPDPSERNRPKDFTVHLVRDPMVSVSRIVGRGDGGLPFLDDATRRLSVTAFGGVLNEIGIEPVVSVAYAKVIIEVFEPADLFQPIWNALGRVDDLDLDELHRLDWSPLRDDFSPEPTKTIRIAAMKGKD